LAVRVWAPRDRLEVVKLAVPLLGLMVTVPRGVPPSENCTCPVALVGVTTAVSVSGWPLVTVLAGADARLVVLFFLVTVRVTAFEVLAGLTASPR
jgi:hypothetical protein